MLQIAQGEFGMTPSAIVMTVLLLVAFTAFGFIMRPRVLLLLRAKPEARFDRWGERHYERV